MIKMSATVFSFGEEGVEGVGVVSKSASIKREDFIFLSSSIRGNKWWFCSGKEDSCFSAMALRAAICQYLSVFR
uniref:Uncharacterized protein n=1 Tax=Rhizophora mucronata TaxID=61149 RepID=A0A2P2QVX2_RHIMU